MLTKSLTYQGLGADGLLLITPYYNKSNEEGIYQHFKTVADAVDIPCILYNIPGRCGCGISERNVERLAAHPNIMGIKEASGNVAYAAKIAHLLSDDFRMYSGEDALTVPLMSLGASGTISVWADVQPQLVHDMCRAIWTATWSAPAISRLPASRSSMPSLARSTPFPSRKHSPRWV